MVTITFADLTHVGAVVDANYAPLSIGYVAGYAQAHLGADVGLRLFRYPSKFGAYITDNTPTIACFSNYMWNERLHLEFAKRLKLRYPEVVTVFGGPNYPTSENEQKKFLLDREQIDFYVDGEGEAAFVGLFKALESVDFNHAALKSSLTGIPNVHYLVGGTSVRGALLPRLSNLDDTLPSPYLSGLMDEFFDDTLQPLVQTSRGCPYRCTFCHDGIAYMNKTHRFSLDRIREELTYIASRVKVPGLTFADLNWGMFPDDMETAKILAEFQKEKGWPVYIASATAKNQKERVVEMSRLLGGSIQVGAAIQSTDLEVLDNIKRSNIGFDAIVNMARDSVEANAPSFCEVILGLPGDTKEKHFKSVLDMMDAGLEDMRTYQFIMLPGTESAGDESREQYEYETRFRVLPRCFGRYEVYGEDLAVAEFHEVCVANNTMTLDDYLGCRDFDLSLSIFNNGNVSEEIWGLAKTFQIPRSELFLAIHERAVASEGHLGELYGQFREDENRNFFKSREEIEAFLNQPDGIEAYISGENGSNQIFKFRSIAVFEMLEDVTDVTLDTLRTALRSRSILTPTLEQYLDELREVILARKSRVLEIERTVQMPVHFDFTAMGEQKYLLDPQEKYVPEGMNITIGHSPSQVKYLKGYFNQYSASLDGLIYFIHRNPASLLYRGVSPVGA